MAQQTEQSKNESAVVSLVTRNSDKYAYYEVDSLKLCVVDCIYKYYSHIIGKEEKRMIEIADNVHGS